MRQSGDDRDGSKSRQHEQILAAAAEDPDASLAELADRVQGVSPETVERVLDEQDEQSDDDDPEASDRYPDREDVSDRQIRTLQAIAAHPDATQRDIASFLDVTAATVSNRVNSLPGFEWDKRRQFVKEVLDLDSVPGGERSVLVASTEIELHEVIHDLVDRVERLEAQLQTTGDRSGSKPLFDDTELARKVVHACIESDRISDEEELRILEALVDK